MTGNRSIAAHHEAGHVVARLSLGLGFGRAWIKDDGTGLVERLSGRPTPYLSAICSIAGPAAEAIYRNIPIGNTNGRTDRNHAERAAAHGKGFPFDDALQAAQALVQPAWPEIEAVAARLCAVGEIGPDEAHEIMRRCRRAAA